MQASALLPVPHTQVCSLGVYLQVFFCGGCRYRVTAYRDWPVYKVKQALFAGGIARANKPEGVRNTPGIRGWDDLVRIVLEHMV